MVDIYPRTSDIREAFKQLFLEKRFTGINRESEMTNLVGNTTIELVAVNFIADEDAIFGEVNWDYVRREEEWYNSMSLNVNDIPGGTPAIWKAVADKTTGEINSNYGWCIYSSLNFSLKHLESNEDHFLGDLQPDNPTTSSCQYSAVLNELRKNPESRRAVMIYTRPSMWLDYNKGGRNDFMCTNAVSYLIRNEKLQAHVQMRSNDAWAGYRNDRAWQAHVQKKLADELNVDVGNLYWTVSSLHVYARNYYLIDHYAQTGKMTISKEEYRQLYPNSPYL